MTAVQQRLFSDIAAAKTALDVTGFGHIDVADYLEREWPLYAPFADKDFVREIRAATTEIGKHQEAGPARTAAFANFHRRYWELYVGVGLIRRGLSLVPFASRASEGPDHIVTLGSKRVCIECICVGPGTSADRVPSYDDAKGDAVSVPDNELSLRLLAGIHEKTANQLPRWLKSGCVSTSDSVVIAINDRLADYAKTDYEPPRIARVLLGLGHLQVQWRTASEEPSQLFIESQSTRLKKSGSQVAANRFEDSSLAQVSAVLYNCIDAWNRAPMDACDFCLVSNPFAQSPTPVGWFPRSQEWYRDRSTTPERIAMRSHQMPL
ncbi:MAG: hypothetical protein K2Y21_04750 [Phycisphaerales bacterium]|nr:hypothetical protein [Phycisphaerales bacterium]